MDLRGIWLILASGVEACQYRTYHVHSLPGIGWKGEDKLDSKRVTFASGALTLEGVLTVPSGVGLADQVAVAIAHPHPLFGGDMDNGVVLAIADRLARLGIPSLRFNFRGVGRSEGQYDDGRGELDDLKAAVSFLGGVRGVDPTRIGLAGYSFGAEIVLRMAAQRPGRHPVVAVSPMVSSVTGKGWQLVSVPKLVICGDSDAFLPVEKLVSGTLEEERVVIAGEDHFWMCKADEMADAAAEFFVRAFDLAPTPDKASE